MLEVAATCATSVSRCATQMSERAVRNHHYVLTLLSELGYEEFMVALLDSPILITIKYWTCFLE